MNNHSKTDSPKRDQILASALTLVSRYGFHGTSMSMLAAEANCGTGTIYNYFNSKDELLEALFRKLKTGFVTAVLANDMEQAPLEQRFMHMWHNAMVYFLDFPENAAFFQQYHSSPYFNSESAKFTENILSPLLTILQTAMQWGQIRTIPQPVLESLTIDLATSLARRHVNGEITLTEALIQETGRACWRSLQAE
jgi:TetR/AcrR family transcriptional repressor of multidrug resistance operon